MAKNLLTTYSGKVNPSSPQYPYGEPRDVTLNGDGTGTPWQAELVKDIYGFLQALLVEGNIVPSNLADNATSSQYLEGIKKISSSYTTIAEATAKVPNRPFTCSGFHTASDGGGGTWVPTGSTISPSLLPKDTGTATLSDVDGNEYTLANLNHIDIAALGVIDTEDASVIFNAALASVSGGGEVTNMSGYTISCSTTIQVPASKALTLDIGKVRLEDGADTQLLEGDSCARVTLRGIFVDGNKGNQTPLGVGESRFLVDFTNSTGIKIEGLYLKNSIGGTISVSDSDDVLVTNNSVFASTKAAIQVAGGITGCNNVVISSNVVDGVAEGAGIIPMGLSTYVTIANNSISNIQGDGGDAITCYGDTQKHITISGNVIKSVVGHGIHAGADYTTVVGNTIDSATGAGIYIRAQSVIVNNVSVCGNVINADTINPATTFARDGIYINNVNGFTVSGNAIDNAQDVGLHFKQCKHGVISANTVRSSLGYGIYSEIDGSMNVYIGNVIRNTADTGMLFDDEGQGKITGNIIEGWSSVEATGYGIDILDGIFMVVDNNTIRASGATVPPTDNSVRNASDTSIFRYNNITSGSNILKGAVTAATNTTLPDEYDFIIVSGVTQIDDFSAGYEGREVTLRCTSAGLTIKDGVGNIQLNGDFVTSGTQSIIKLISNNDVWYETSRSVNS